MLSPAEATALDTLRVVGIVSRQVGAMLIAEHRYRITVMGQEKAEQALVQRVGAIEQAYREIKFYYVRS